MKRLKSKAGFSLVELMVTILVLVILFAGVGVSMDVGSKVYRESVFQSHSALLEETLNNSLSDILRNSTDIHVNDGTMEDGQGNILPASQVGFLFSNSNFAAQDAYIRISSTRRHLEIKNSSNPDGQPLVNMGAYPELGIEDFKVDYYPQNSKGTTGEKYGGYFKISYKIVSTQYDSMSREVQTVVRLLNDP